MRNKSPSGVDIGLSVSNICCSILKIFVDLSPMEKQYNSRPRANQ